MKYIFSVFYFTLIINFQTSRSHHNDLDDGTKLTTLAENIWNLYQLSSIIIVYDDKFWKDLHFQTKVMKEVRKYALNGIRSQGISYTRMDTMTRYFDNRSFTVLESKLLFSMNIHDQQGLEKFKILSRFWSVWMCTWLTTFEDKMSEDCATPRGNPFNLKLDSLMIVRCGNSSSIKKYSSILKNVTEVVDLGEWTTDQKLIVNTDLHPLSEKINLRGLLLTQVGLINFQSNYNKESIKFFSAFMNVFRSMGNFTTEIVRRMKTKGIYNTSTKKSEGIISVLANKEVDMAATLISMSTSRMQVIDFTIPLQNAKNYFYMKTSYNPKIQWRAYFIVFGKYIWIVTGLIIFISPILLLLTKQQNIHIKDANTYFDILINILCIFCQQGFLDRPFYRSTQILYISIMLLSLILNNIYSASITSYWTLFSADLPFTNYLEFFKDNSYKIIAIRGSKENYDVADDDPMMVPIRHRLKSFNQLPNNSMDAMNELCSGNNVALYTHQLEFNSLGENDSCTFGGLIVPRITPVSLGLSKFSPYTKVFNYYVLRVRDYGVLDRLIKKYFYEYDKTPRVITREISIIHITPILVNFVVGIIISLFILIFEILCYRLNLCTEG